MGAWDSRHSATGARGVRHGATGLCNQSTFRLGAWGLRYGIRGASHVVSDSRHGACRGAMIRMRLCLFGVDVVY